jgi:hypothetical protein
MNPTPPSHASITQPKHNLTIIRAKLHHLQNAINSAEQALQKAIEVRHALQHRDQVRGLMMYDSDPDSSDSDVSGLDWDEADFPDENEEGFDFQVKYGRLYDEVVRCKRQVLVAQR